MADPARMTSQRMARLNLSRFIALPSSELRQLRRKLLDVALSVRCGTLAQSQDCGKRLEGRGPKTRRGLLAD